MNNTALISAAHEQQSHVLHEGVLAKTAQQFSLSLLTMTNLDSMLGLQEAIIDDLTPDERAFISPKSVQQFSDYLLHKGLVLGVFVENQLVAQMIVGLPATFAAAFAPGAGLTATGADFAVTPLEPVGIVQNVLVHPQFRGNKLMQHMLHAAECVSGALGINHLLAEIADGNAHSANSFKSAAYEVCAKATDPSDGTPLVFLHKPLKSKLNGHASVTAKYKGQVYG